MITNIDNNIEKFNGVIEQFNWKKKVNRVVEFKLKNLEKDPHAFLKNNILMVVGAIALIASVVFISYVALPLTFACILSGWAFTLITLSSCIFIASNNKNFLEEKSQELKKEMKDLKIENESRIESLKNSLVEATYEMEELEKENPLLQLKINSNNDKKFDESEFNKKFPDLKNHRKKEQFFYEYQENFKTECSSQINKNIKKIKKLELSCNKIKSFLNSITSSTMQMEVNGQTPDRSDYCAFFGDISRPTIQNDLRPIRI